jgi:hypothetical protein
LEEKKICIHCNLEKDIDEFGKYRKRSGEIGYRNVCKQCKLEQDRKGLGTRTREYKPRVREETPVEYKVERDYIDMLNEEDKIKLESLLVHYEAIMDIVNKTINLWDIEDIKANRVHKSIKMNPELDKIILDYARKSRLSYSDVCNIALREGLKTLKVEK